MKKFKLLVLIAVFLLFGLIATNYVVSFKARSHIYDSVDAIPEEQSRFGTWRC